MKKIEIILKNNLADDPLKYSIGSETTVGYKIPGEFIEKDMFDSFYEKLNHLFCFSILYKPLKSNLQIEHYGKE